MLDRDIGLTRKPPQDAANIPTARIARVERQRTIDQPDHRPDVLAEIGKRKAGIGKRARVVASDLQGPMREIGAPAPVRLRVFAQPVDDRAAGGRPRPKQVPGRNADRDRSPDREAAALEEILSR